LLILRCGAALSVAALTGCFSKPDAPAANDAAVSDGNIDAAEQPRPCTPLPNGAEFASYRNGAVGRLDGDALDDMAVFGTVPSTVAGKREPHVWVYHGSRSGFDLQCPHEDFAFANWTLVGAVDIAPFPNRDGLLIVAGISGNPAMASSRAMEYSVTDYLNGVKKSESHMSWPAPNAVPDWMPNKLNMGSFIASRTTNDGSAQQILLGGADRVFGITWHGADGALSAAGFTHASGAGLYQALYLPSGMFYGATSNANVGAYIYEVRSDAMPTSAQVSLMDDNISGRGSNGNIGAARHTFDGALLRSPMLPITGDQVIEIRQAELATSLVTLTIPKSDAPGLHIQEVATRDRTPATPLWVLMGEVYKPYNPHKLMRFSNQAKDQNGGLLITNKNTVEIETSDIVLAGEPTPMLITGRFNGTHETARVMWQTITGMTSKCFEPDGLNALGEVPCKL
jgi:hypothetical protein